MFKSVSASGGGSSSDLRSILTAGVVGDGVTDDAVAINAALNSAEGVTWFFPGDRTYLCSGNVIKLKTSYVDVVIANGATLKLKNSTLANQGVLFSLGDPTFAVQTTDCRLFIYGTLDGNRANQYNGTNSSTDGTNTCLGIYRISDWLVDGGGTGVIKDADGYSIGSAGSNRLDRSRGRITNFDYIGGSAYDQIDLKVGVENITIDHNRIYNVGGGAITNREGRGADVRGEYVKFEHNFIDGEGTGEGNARVRVNAGGHLQFNHNTSINAPYGTYGFDLSGSGDGIYEHFGNISQDDYIGVKISRGHHRLHGWSVRDAQVHNVFVTDASPDNFGTSASANTISGPSEKISNSISFTPHASTPTINITSGFTAAGFGADTTWVRVVGSELNDGFYQVASVSDTTITLTAGTTLQTEAANDTVRVIECKQFVASNTENFGPGELIDMVITASPTNYMRMRVIDAVASTNKVTCQVESIAGSGTASGWTLYAVNTGSVQIIGGDYINAGTDNINIDNTVYPITIVGATLADAGRRNIDLDNNELYVYDCRISGGVSTDILVSNQTFPYQIVNNQLPAGEISFSGTNSGEGLIAFNDFGTASTAGFSGTVPVTCHVQGNMPYSDTTIRDLTMFHRLSMEVLRLASNQNDGVEAGGSTTTNSDITIVADLATLTIPVAATTSWAAGDMGRVDDGAGKTIDFRVNTVNAGVSLDVVSIHSVGTGTITSGAAVKEWTGIFAIGNQVYEIDFANNGVAAGRIAVVPATSNSPTNVSAAITTTFNANTTLPIKAYNVNTDVVFVSTVTGSYSNTNFYETLTGTNNAFQKATPTLSGGADPAVRRESHLTRSPSSGEASYGRVYQPMDFIPSIAQIRLTDSTGNAKAWFGKTKFTTMGDGRGTLELTNQTPSSVTLNGATPVTVNDATFGSGSLVQFQLKTVGGTVGQYPAIQTVTPGTGFTVAGTAGDTSVYHYWIINPTFVSGDIFHISARE